MCDLKWLFKQKLVPFVNHQSVLSWVLLLNIDLVRTDFTSLDIYTNICHNI